MENLSSDLSDAVQREKAAYAQGEDPPLESFAGVMVTYSAAVAGLSTLVRLTGRRLPERFDVRDIALAGIATHKVTRLLTKAPVTSPLRAPFTTFAGAGGPGEVKEEVRGHGVRHAVGELLTCPFCLSQWSATGFTFGLVFAPRVTRAVAGVFTIVAVSDFLQYAYAMAQQSEK